MVLEEILTLTPENCNFIISGVMQCFLKSHGGITNGTRYSDWLSTQHYQQYLRVLENRDYTNNEELGEWWNDAIFRLIFDFYDITEGEQIVLIFTVRSPDIDQDVQIFKGVDVHTIKCRKGLKENHLIVIDDAVGPTYFEVFIRPTVYSRLDFFSASVLIARG